MRSTLFYIPHEIAGVPLFGFGWALLALLLAAVIWFAWALVHKQPLNDLLGTLPVWLAAMAIVIFVLPSVETTLEDGQKLGLPIRGYGVMVLLGLLAGIGITVARGQQLGIHPDTVIGLGFWMMLGGILGARAFYVVQKWNEFPGQGIWERLVDIIRITEGGLVIYGGVLGGLLAGSIYCYRHRLNVAATADLIAPGFLMGLSLGRIGCLLHGCCFGGLCTAGLPAIQFPAGSVPYNAQLATGQLVAAESDISDELPSATQELPAWSRPVHPSQIYASINGLLLCLLVWHWQPVPRRDGVVFLGAIALYALSRFLLEGVRSDEAGQFGTPLTIAQVLSLASGVVALVGLWFLSKRPSARIWNWSKAA